MRASASGKVVWARVPFERTELGEVAPDVDVDALLDFENKAPASRLAHPRTDHFAPLFVALGAAGDDVHENHVPIEGFWWNLAKRSVQFG